MSRASIINQLHHFHLFSALDDAQLAYVAREAQLLKVARNDILFHRGDAAHGFFLLLSGQIKLAINSPQGSEKVIGIIGPNESFGEAIIFLDRPFFPIYAQATMNSRLLQISKSTIVNLLEQDPIIARKMLAGLSTRNHQLLRDIESVALLSGTQRLIGYLLQYSAEATDSNNITLPASKSTIASLLNLTPETLSRVMLKLQQQGLIKVRGKVITIMDIAGLRDYEA